MEIGALGVCGHPASPIVAQELPQGTGHVGPQTVKAMLSALPKALTQNLKPVMLDPVQVSKGKQNAIIV